MTAENTRIAQAIREDREVDNDMTASRYSSINSREQGRRVRDNVSPMVASLQPAEEKGLMAAERAEREREEGGREKRSEKRKHKGEEVRSPRGCHG